MGNTITDKKKVFRRGSEYLLRLLDIPMAMIESTSDDNVDRKTYRKMNRGFHFHQARKSGGASVLGFPSLGVWALFMCVFQILLT
jgi:hypothetical protein